MALALSPLQPATDTSARALVADRHLRPAQPASRERHAVTALSTSGTASGMRLSVECRTRRNQHVRERYLAEVRAQRRAVYMRRRLGAVVLGITIAAAACLGVRAMASRGDGTASLPTVTPAGSAVLVSGLASGGTTADDLDLSGTLVHGEQIYIVQPGDTLWSIASSLTDGNIRGYVSELIAINGSPSIDVGQRLVLPAG